MTVLSIFTGLAHKQGPFVLSQKQGNNIYYFAETALESPRHAMQLVADPSRAKQFTSKLAAWWTKLQLSGDEKRPIRLQRASEVAP